MALGGTALGRDDGGEPAMAVAAAGAGAAARLGSRRGAVGAPRGAGWAGPAAGRGGDLRAGTTGWRRPSRGSARFLVGAAMCLPFVVGPAVRLGNRAGAAAAAALGLVRHRAAVARPEPGLDGASAGAGGEYRGLDDGRVVPADLPRLARPAVRGGVYLRAADEDQAARLRDWLAAREVPVLPIWEARATGGGRAGGSLRRRRRPDLPRELAGAGRAGRSLGPCGAAARR